MVNEIIHLSFSAQLCQVAAQLFQCRPVRRRRQLDSMGKANLRNVSITFYIF